MCVCLLVWWVIGVPLGAVLALVLHMGLIGLWIGLCAGVGTLLALYLFVILRMDWKAVRCQRGGFADIASGGAVMMCWEEGTSLTRSFRMRVQVAEKASQAHLMDETGVSTYSPNTTGIYPETSDADDRDETVRVSVPSGRLFIVDGRRVRVFSRHC